MKKIVILISFFGASLAAFSQTTVREKLYMDRNWKFHLGDASNPAKDFNYGIDRVGFVKAGEGTGVMRTDFNDSNWRTVDLPHDWAVELGFVNVKDDQVMSHGYKPIGALFPETSIGWYRKRFYINAADSGNRFVIHFDGVFRDYMVFLNGHFLGNCLSGYTGSSFDITDYTNYNSANEIVVRVNATQYEGWFYEGAGIYRHVWLEKYNPIHIAEYGVFVVTDSISNSGAFLTLSTHIEKPFSEKSLAAVFRQEIYDNQGMQVYSYQEPVYTILDKTEMVENIKLPAPKLWSPAEPNLYTLITKIYSFNELIDSVSTVFGVRTIRIDKDSGVILNGRRIKIQGVNCHQDHAGVGIALPDALQYYRVRLLKEMGVNAYRTSHHPPTPELLNACDELGLLVLDETRITGSGGEYMDQFEKLIKRDRNHPSVFLWSIGNEEAWIQKTDIGKRMAISLIEKQMELDPSRTCTYAADMGNERKGINEVIPVRGFNYRISSIDDYHRDNPRQPIVGTETGSTVCTRGIYAKDDVMAYVPDHDITYPWWASTAEQWWKPNAEKKWFMGGFVWTGFDYRGEPTPYEWPNINSHFGIMDVCGFPKNNYYYYQSWWSNKDVLQLSPHWNLISDSVNVWCNSNADSVELKVNGKSAGRKRMEKNGHLEWNIKYERGKVEAFGWKNGRKLYTKVETTGMPVKIITRPDRETIKADGEDICVVNISVVDSKGREVPDAMNMIYFTIAGNAKIIGVGNGDPSSHQPDKCPEGKWQRSLFNGKCQVIVQSTAYEGSFVLDVTGDRLDAAKVKIAVSGQSIKKYVRDK